MALEQTLELGLERVLAVELAVSVGLVFVIERGLECLSAQERVLAVELASELASELERVSVWELAWVLALAWGWVREPEAWCRQ